MVIIGLTGSIGMGKSATADMFRRLGAAVQDADRVVHGLFSRGGAAVPLISGAFPDAVRDGEVDRGVLGSLVFGKPEELSKLEGIVHPLVRRERESFLKKAALEGRKLAVLDVPLLFETGLDRECDLTVVVTAPHFVQRQRVLRRAGMTAEKLAGIKSRQMSDVDKANRADFVIQTGLGRAPVLASVERIVRLAKGMKGRHWPPAANRFLERF